MEIDGYAPFREALNLKVKANAHCRQQWAFAGACEKVAIKWTPRKATACRRRACEEAGAGLIGPDHQLVSKSS